MADRFLCQKLLAKRWGISHRTLENWRYRGHGLPFLKLGGKVFYKIEDVEAYEARQTEGGSALFSSYGDGQPVRFQDMGYRGAEAGQC
jgi:Helix-turn-helix domain